MQFRDYQDYAINEIFRYFEEGGEGNPLVVMPTGTGKSLVIGGFIQRVLQRFPGQRIIKLTHVKELIEQNFDKLLRLWPTAPAGIYSAGLSRKDTGLPIIYAGIDTAVKNPGAFGHVDLVIIDEAHLVSPEVSTRYQKFISALQEVNPNLRVIGLTATDYRLGQGRLTEKGLFTDVCVDMTGLEAFNWFIQEGYLCSLVPRPTKVELDTAGVTMQKGDYNLKELQLAVDKGEITYAALREALDIGYSRQHWLVFASGIEHTEHVAAMLDSLGVPTTYVHSKMSKGERDRRLQAYKEGKVVAMVNNGILTTGFDFPAIDLIVMLRPTQSPGLWVQMLGRGTRPDYAPGFDLNTTEGRLSAIAESHKRNCLVLDFAGNTRRLGPINDPVIPRRKGKGGGTAPVRICDNCGIYCHASLRECPECGFAFPRSVKFGANADTAVLIAGDTPQVEEFKVDRVVYNEHRKEGRPPSLRASYYCGLRVFEEWICLEHEGYPKKKARDWWRQRSDGNPPPDTVLQAFERLKELKTPTQIKVWLNKKHPEIMNYDYPRTDPIPAD